MLHKLSALLIVLFLTLCLQIAAFAENNGEAELWDGDFRYRIQEDGTVIITGHAATREKKKEDGSVSYLAGGQEYLEIPATIQGMTVTAIDNYTFTNTVNMKTIVFPESLREIGESTFWDSGITSVRFPSSLTKIGDGAFTDCKNLEKVEFADGEAVDIGKGAFRGARIKSFFVPDSHPNLAVYQGVLFEKNKKELIAYPIADTRASYEIPRGIRVIGQEAFSCSALESVTVPDSVTEIGFCAFSGCNSLSEILLPDSVRIIRAYAFSACEALKYAQLGAGVTEIEWNAFGSCESLQSIYLPASLERLDPSAFSECTSLQAVTVSKNNPNFFDVDNVLFSGNKLLLFPAGLDCDEYTVPDFVRIISGDAFHDTKIRKLTIPENVLMIWDGAFDYMPNLEELYLQEGLLVMPYGYYETTNLKEITVPASVTLIQSGFGDCPPTIRVYRGSYAEQFFTENDIPFETLDQEQESTSQESEPLWLFEKKTLNDVKTAIEIFPEGADSDDESCLSEWVTRNGLHSNMDKANRWIQTLLDPENTEIEYPEELKGNWYFVLIGADGDETVRIESAGSIEEMAQNIAGMEKCSELILYRYGIFYHFMLTDESQPYCCILLYPGKEKPDILLSDEGLDYTYLFIKWEGTGLPDEKEHIELNIPDDDLYSCNF